MSVSAHTGSLGSSSEEKYRMKGKFFTALEIIFHATICYCRFFLTPSMMPFSLAFNL